MRPLLLLVSLAACGTSGALGQASMFKERPETAAPLAVGARLRPTVSVDVGGSVMPVVALSSTREDVIAVEDGALVAKRPGMAAVLIATEDGTVIDFQHLWVAEPTAVVVAQGAEELVGPLELIAGEQVVLSSTLLGGTQRLAGEGAMTWTVDGDAIALLRDGSSGRRRLVARRPGRSTITVATLGVSTAVEIEVLP